MNAFLDFSGEDLEDAIVPKESLVPAGYVIDLDAALCDCAPAQIRLSFEVDRLLE